MTVAELMEKLSQFDLDMVVTVSDDYGHYHTAIKNAVEVKALNSSNDETCFIPSDDSHNHKYFDGRHRTIIRLH